jgi:hypothetical protein
MKPKIVINKKKCDELKSKGMFNPLFNEITLANRKDRETYEHEYAHWFHFQHFPEDWQQDWAGTNLEVMMEAVAFFWQKRCGYEIEEGWISRRDLYSKAAKFVHMSWIDLKELDLIDGIKYIRKYYHTSLRK